MPQVRPTYFFFTSLTPDNFTRQWEALQLNGLNSVFCYAATPSSTITNLSIVFLDY